MQTPPPQTSIEVRKKRSPLMIGIIALVGACFILGIIGAIARPNPTPNNSSAGGTQAQATNTVALPAALAAKPTDAPAASKPTDLPAKPTDVPSTAVPATEPTKPSALTVGSTDETDGLKVTLNSVRHETTGLVPAKAGMEYLIVNLTFENPGNEKKAVSSLISFSVKDDTGQKYTTAFGATTKSSADGSVAPGDKLRGETAFEVPKNATNLAFIYDPVLGGDPLRFKLDR